MLWMWSSGRWAVFVSTWRFAWFWRWSGRVLIHGTSTYTQTDDTAVFWYLHLQCSIIYGTWLFARRTLSLSIHRHHHRRRRRRHHHHHTEISYQKKIYSTVNIKSEEWKNTKKHKSCVNFQVKDKDKDRSQAPDHVQSYCNCSCSIIYLHTSKL